MNSKLETLIAAAMELSDRDRLHLACVLLDSVDPPHKARTEEEWEAEIKRRCHEIDTGKAKTIPWPEVRRKLLEGIDPESEWKEDSN